jgi:hypothetical protein
VGATTYAVARIPVDDRGDRDGSKPHDAAIIPRATNFVLRGIVMATCAVSINRLDPRSVVVFAALGKSNSMIEVEVSR